MIPLRKALIKFRVRYNRGNALMNFAKDMIIVGGMISIILIAMEKFLGAAPPEWLVPLIILMIPVVLYFVGWVDEKKGIFLEEQKYKTKNINPYFQKIESDIEEIKRAVNQNNLKREEQR